MSHTMMVRVREHQVENGAGRSGRAGLVPRGRGHEDVAERSEACSCSGTPALVWVAGRSSCECSERVKPPVRERMGGGYVIAQRLCIREGRDGVSKAAIFVIDLFVVH